MKKINDLIRPTVFSSVISCALFAPLLVAAATGDAALNNPLNKAISTIPDFISKFLQVVVMVALPIIVLFFVYAGFKFLLAQGNENKLNEARKNLLYAVIGAILILGAWVLATLLAGTVTQLINP